MCTTKTVKTTLTSPRSGYYNIHFFLDILMLQLKFVDLLGQSTNRLIYFQRNERTLRVMTNLSKSQSDRGDRFSSIVSTIDEQSVTYLWERRVLTDGQRRGNDESSASRDQCPPAHRCTMPANHCAIAVSDREPIRSTTPSAPTRALAANENVRSRCSDGNGGSNNDDDDDGMNQGRPQGTQRGRHSSHHVSYAKGDAELSLLGQRDGSPIFPRHSRN